MFSAVCSYWILLLSYMFTIYQCHILVKQEPLFKDNRNMKCKGHNQPREQLVKLIPSFNEIVKCRAGRNHKEI